MDNNDVLKRLRYALNIPEPAVAELFASADQAIGEEELRGIFRSEGEAGYVKCSDAILEKFLGALIISRRGRREEGDREETRPKGPAARRRRLSNNDILKLLRIALELREEDMIEIMRLAGSEVTKSELGALFRKPEHPNYRACGDQFLRLFLAGLTAKYRGQ